MSRVKQRGVSELDMVALETPFPFGTFASGLHVLDALLLSTLKREFRPSYVTLYNPAWLTKVHGAKERSKQASQELAQTLLTILPEAGVPVILEGRLNHDLSESILFLTGGLIQINKLNLCSGGEVKTVKSEEITEREAVLREKKRREEKIEREVVLREKKRKETSESITVSPLSIIIKGVIGGESSEGSYNAESQTLKISRLGQPSMSRQTFRTAFSVATDPGYRE